MEKSVAIEVCTHEVFHLSFHDPSMTRKWMPAITQISYTQSKLDARILFHYFLIKCAKHDIIIEKFRINGEFKWERQTF